MFELSLILSALMVVTALIPFSIRSRWYCVFPCLAWVLFWGVVNLANSQIRHVPAVEWLYVFLFVAFLTVWNTKLRWSWFLPIGAGCALIAYGISLVQFIPAYREHQELLAQFPVEDLQSRLVHEQRAQVAVQSGFGDTEVFVSGNVSPRFDVESLNQLDKAFRQYLDFSTLHVERRKTNRRNAFQALMRAHEGFVADFVAQPGLGLSRIPGLKLLRKHHFVDEWMGVRLDVPPELIEQPDPLQPSLNSADQGHDTEAVSTEQSSDDSLIALATMAVNPYADVKSLQGFHYHNITNFVPLNSLGGVNRQFQSRGFEAHAFHQSPTESAWVPRPKGWQLSRLELISLLKHRPAAVYVSNHLPAMDELRAAPTRDLTEFESDAISKLVKGEELVVEQFGDHDLRMVGAIRAIAECRACHQTPIGGLLGAFTYKLK